MIFIGIPRNYGLICLQMELHYLDFFKGGNYLEWRKKIINKVDT